MNRALAQKKEPVMMDVLNFVYAITPEIHKNFQK
jgi:hypothetical protein